MYIEYEWGILTKPNLICCLGSFDGKRPKYCSCRWAVSCQFASASNLGGDGILVDFIVNVTGDDVKLLGGSSHLVSRLYPQL